MKELLEYDKSKLIETLWEYDPIIFKILKSSNKLQEARNSLFDHLNDLERHLFNIYSDKHFKDKNILERNNAKECIRVFKNVIRTENEDITNYSALNSLYRAAKKKAKSDSLNVGFFLEFINLFKGINCESGMYAEKEVPLFISLNGHTAALERMKILDDYSSNVENYFLRYKTGMDKYLIEERKNNKKSILDFFNATDKDWQNYNWQIKNIISDIDTLLCLVRLSDDEVRGLECARKNCIPFQITPHYLSLFDRENSGKYDHAIRAQVLPSENYCWNYMLSKDNGTNLDFMGEKSTSPIKGITRRYPQILILKPFDSCPQICVYCQRNWEITDIKDAVFSRESMKNALDWISNNKNIKEVLITGGDPLTLDDVSINWLLSKISGIGHIERIRIGTRIIVTMPQRITDELIGIFDKYHTFGTRELCIVTHFEHPTEFTPDTLEAIKKIKKLGINMYNQQVFTYYNSKKYESSFLRTVLKKSGIDPYYTFNTKGKDETIDYRVPIARIEQEREEEARFLPGMVRTDEPVFNVPRLGKSYLRSWQDHEVIMILEDGRRVYRFYPWESKYAFVEPYNYTDVSIFEYLKRLKDDNENVDDYSSIWYYF
ncbi:MAG: L-lysine 2,3-aminomutase [Candidatus Methanoperedens nitroreducens]|uniref:L-lysine 2,3-aminomutase n=1 Tax=Candidatus Methanoperedens nitratireducens TaxID=1392998 RepID=A0A0P8CLR0_9EURY|nr:KamA family radical SAM protein [Candidatus Methanoperedens sp. BLZ2]KAB2943383.1 MAG: KamA family radical SAM protein [Candidatus Methanoperedens sp.]KPQ44215.1 MAG: L-lysine 2,3-aminomutase [Candidatus Methanoperedens sp. BLZ1]MBZ0173843.1 KamA family radical SAM protein [Candidatus Methanoperedens nitroreducens]CAG0995095.1 lysine 2,3-aminomutase [Methanosarcinales archaeon]MCX9077639.1 KamA family radical SAM protein [Candidatus Methanoperedens sp.]